MAYKEKTCPKCGTIHYKRGEFCSRSCGNTRKHTEHTKQKIAVRQTERHANGDDIAEEQRLALAIANERHHDPVPPQQYSRLGMNQFVDDGDLWTEV